MTPSYGPSIEHFLIVFGFIVLILTVFYFFKKNRHLISSKLHNKKRMKVSEVTMLGQGDRALILSLDNKDFLFISGKNSGAILTEIKQNNSKLKNFELKNILEKRIKDEKI